jgi:flagellar basal body L-ring protein FlgH
VDEARLQANVLTERKEQYKAEEMEQIIHLKQVSERFQQQTALTLGDVILVVVNELTSTEQEFIERLLVEIKSGRQRKKIIMVHNYRNVDSADALSNNISVRESSSKKERKKKNSLRV